MTSQGNVSTYDSTHTSTNIHVQYRETSATSRETTPMMAMKTVFPSEYTSATLSSSLATVAYHVNRNITCRPHLLHYYRFGPEAPVAV